jgi:hypothetical protein
MVNAHAWDNRESLLAHEISTAVEDAMVIEARA